MLYFGCFVVANSDYQMPSEISKYVSADTLKQAQSYLKPEQLQAIQQAIGKSGSSIPNIVKGLGNYKVPDQTASQITDLANKYATGAADKLAPGSGTGAPQAGSPPVGGDTPAPPPPPETPGDTSSPPTSPDAPAELTPGAADSLATMTDDTAAPSSTETDASYASPSPGYGAPSSAPQIMISFTVLSAVSLIN